jgi:hypothetical protein
MTLEELQVEQSELPWESRPPELWHIRPDMNPKLAS